jgi:hypothetical protein
VDDLEDMLPQAEDVDSNKDVGLIGGAYVTCMTG